MSTQFLAAIVSILVVILPRFGVEVGSEELTALIQAIVVTVSSIWVMIQRLKLKRVAPGEETDVTPLGFRKF